MDYEELKMLEEARLQTESSDKQEEAISDDVLICECMCISMGDIREFCKENEAKLSNLSRELGLGTGCSSCSKSFDQWKDKI